MNIAFFASSILSAYWNGACTYYRGIVRNLHARGHSITFYEPDAFDRQAHRDISDPDWVEVVVYPAEDEGEVRDVVKGARGADVVVKANGVGVFDDLLETSVLEFHSDDSIVVFWDVDAPATLGNLEADGGASLRPLIPRYDAVLTYGGGDPVVERYMSLGARSCVPVYNALDPTTHHPVEPDERYSADVSFLGNRLPDREARVDEFFFRAAARASGSRFLLAGAGWEDRSTSPNVHYAGHVPPNDHNAFNSTPSCVLNISRESMARNGFSPATRVFEAAGAGSCIITDAWEGIEMFLEPGAEILVARDGDEVAELAASTTPEMGRRVGRAALERVLAEHTYEHRAEQVERALADLAKRP